jgi:SAM-dependent methyltransferase
VSAEPSPTPEPVSEPDPGTETSLALTGERTVPGIPDERYWFERHVVAYRLAERRAGGKRVLDAGCGEGYGAAALARAGAAQVTAVDVDPSVVAHVNRTYPEVEAVEAELGTLPFPDGAFDLIVSFQVIEHVWDIPAYLVSLRRVLAPGGEVMIATPNRITFTPGSETPVNPFHFREFAPDELRDELERAGFKVGALLGLHHGRRLRALETLYGLRPATGWSSLPRLLAERPPREWPPGLRPLVHRVRAPWFRLRADQLQESLDLIALCRRAPDPSPGAPR